MESHLLQMRGLKQKNCAATDGLTWSHLLQMRGLKHKFLRLLLRLPNSRIFYRCVD